MDNYLVIYSLLAVINISLFFVYISSLLSRKILISIGIIIIAIIATFGLLKPIKQEINTLNDCIAYYTYIKVLPEKYSFNFLERCDFSKEQIIKLNNYSNIPTFTYPTKGNWNKEEIDDNGRFNITWD